jgi:uroporphyrinogen-III decarboxylase
VAEFILPYEKAIFAEFPHAVRIYHNEGRHSDEHIAMVLDFGADVWHFGSDVHPLPNLLSKVGDRIVLFGGLDPHGVIRKGTPAEVRAATRELLRQAAGRRLILSTGTGTTPDTSLENLRAMVGRVESPSSS